VPDLGGVEGNYGGEVRWFGIADGDVCHGGYGVFY
jgi:hypothetical protein